MSVSRISHTAPKEPLSYVPNGKPLDRVRAPSEHNWSAYIKYDVAFKKGGLVPLVSGFTN